MIRTTWWVAGVIGLGLFASARHAAGQSLVAGEIRVVVTDTAGNPLADALVTVTGRSGSARLVEQSHDREFRFAGIPPGVYGIHVEAIGYRPVRLTDVAVGPGRVVVVPVVLPAVEPPVTTIDTMPFHGRGTATSGSGVGQWLDVLELHTVPDADRRLVDAARAVSFASADGAVQGLGPGLSGSLIDGSPFTGTRHPFLPGDPAAGAAFARLPFTLAEFVTNAVDVERGEYAGGQLSAYWRRGTGRLEGRLFGDWTGDALQSAGHFTAPAFSGLRGGGVLSGPIIRDTAHFVVGVEGQRRHGPLPRAWTRTGSDSLLGAVGDSTGVNVRRQLAPRREELERVMAFGRLDWRVAPQHAFEVWTSVGSGRWTNPDLGAGAWPNLGAVVRSTDITAGATLTSALAEAVVSELRVGFERGDREYRAGAFAATTLTRPGLRLGTDPGLPGEVGRTAVRASGVLHLTSGAHRVKVGAALATLSYDLTYAYARGGAFVFADAAALEAGTGVYAQAAGPPPAARYSTQQLAAFIQDAWTVGAGFDLTIGLRYEHELLPDGAIVPNDAWRSASGIRNDSVEFRSSKVSPRIGFRWLLGEDGGWIVRGQSGVYYDRVDPALLGEAVTHAGQVEQVRGVGALGAWPGTPDDVAAPSRGPRLTILGPAYEAPRTSRASFGVTRQFGRGAALHLSTSYRHTDFLPRRTDLNLLPSPVGADQHGRAVFGTLVQQGPVLTAAPGSNRRFGQFGPVTAINVDGVSDYWDVTAAAEHRGDRVDLVARYTYSQTTDNWMGAAARTPDAAYHPFPGGPDDWADGRSDYDVPHRLVLLAALRPFGESVTIAGLYRFESAVPFTPGYQLGVDANADGFAGNDPAFIDAALDGMAPLLARWDCLRTRSGRFAERNGCRGKSTRQFDLRVTIGMAPGGVPVAAVIDVLNVFDEAFAVPDPALYIIDPAGTVMTDASTGDVTVPLVPNAAFGTALQQLGTGRAVRLGVRVNY